MSDLLLQAHHKAKAASRKWAFWDDSNYEDAAELYRRASHLFLMQKDYVQGCDALVNSAKMFLKEHMHLEAAADYINIAKINQKHICNDSISIYYLKEAIQVYVEKCKFKLAAHEYYKIGEINEKMSNISDAIEAYEIAADYYDNENMQSDAIKCLFKVADLSSQIEKYERAIEIYQSIYQLYNKTIALRWNAPKIFLKTCLCHLAHHDLIGCKNEITKFREINPFFEKDDRCKFLEKIVLTLENNDVESYTIICKDFDSMIGMDSWMITLLLRIKTTLSPHDLS